MSTPRRQANSIIAAGPQSPRRFRINPRLAGGILILLAVGLAAGMALAAINGLYFKNDFFRLETIEISADGDQKLKNAVRDYLVSHGVVPFETLLPQINIRSIRDDLLHHNDDTAARLADVAIRRINPNKLQVTLMPRIPVAIISGRDLATGAPFNAKIDQYGYVMPLDAPARRKRIPHVIGVSADRAEFVLGRKTTNLGVQAFLTFLNQVWLQQNRSFYEVQICRLDKLDNHQMTLQLEARGPFRSNATIVMPTDNIASSLERVNIVVNLRMERNQTISYINAKYEKIPVRP